MRRCNHCGAQYSDKVSICPADGWPTVNPQAKPGSEFGSAGGLAGFNIKVVSPLSAAGSYRVFVQSSDPVSVFFLTVILSAVEPHEQFCHEPVRTLGNAARRLV